MRSLVLLFLPLFCVVDLETTTGLMSAAREFMMHAGQTTYHACCRARSANHWGRFVLACAEAQRVYGTARESYNERTRNTLKHSICSHKWWETLKVSIFNVKPSIPALSGPGGALVVAPAEKASLLGSQFDSKQCREQFITRLSCFSQSRCNYLAFQTPLLLRLLLDHDTYGGVNPLGVFPLFLKMVAESIAPKLSIIFLDLMRRGSFPEYWQSANVTAISKCFPSPDNENYRHILITVTYQRCMRS